MIRDTATSLPKPPVASIGVIALFAFAPGMVAAEGGGPDGSTLDPRLEGYEFECAAVIYETSWFWASFDEDVIPAPARASGLEAVHAACGGWDVFPATVEGLPIIPLPAAVDPFVDGVQEFKREGPGAGLCKNGNDWCSYMLFFGACKMPADIDQGSLALRAPYV